VAQTNKLFFTVIIPNETVISSRK